MKVMLVKPYNVTDHIQPSLGLGYLATSIRDRHEVKLVDCIKEDITLDKLGELISRERPDILGLQCYTFDLKFVGGALKLAKEINRDTVTVVGGPHPSAMPERMLSAFKGDLDYLFVGEAEKGFPALVDSLGAKDPALTSIPGLAWLQNGVFRSNPSVVVDDLDSLGLPAWDMIKPEGYPESQHGAFFKQFPIAPIMVTRGCPYPCTFCAGKVVSGKNIRRRSIDSVLGELTVLCRERGIREFHIVDDNFTMDKEYAKELLRRLKKLNLGMTWAVPNGVRMETLDEELLYLMKETGLYLISLGIESGSDAVLRSMKKGTTVAKIRQCVELIRSCGIDMAGFFILGFPSETEATIRQTIDFSLSLGLVRANYFMYLPFPGSESYRELEAAGELDTVSWERFYFMNASYVPKGMTKKRLKYLHRLAFAKFFLRPGIIIYNLKSIKSVRHFMFLIKRFFHWILMG